MTLAAHLFASDSDGSLWDTRSPNWTLGAPLRRRYKGARRQPDEMDLQDVKAALRAGPYAWPGGYPMYFLTRDGAALSYASVREQWRNVVWDHLSDASTGWRVVACDINYEDSDLRCDHSGERIESAYAEEESD